MLPSVLLHDHLDGGLRPSTVISLAADAAVDLPTTDEDGLANWFDQSEAQSLERYLEAFSVTTAVMQSEPALRRVTLEALEDLAASGVAYAEIRFAPLLHTAGGLDMEEVVGVVLSAMRDTELPIEARLILCAMRQSDGVALVAELAASARDSGVVGFDLVGPERGYPASLHRTACETAAAAVGLTIHAGEAAGVDSIADALSCGALRLGHGIEIAEDCVYQGPDIVGFGPIAAEVHDRRVPLEVCVSSNLDTKGWTPDRHPVGALHRAGFCVTLNTDDRLMTRTSIDREFSLVAEHHRFGIEDFATVTRNALAAAFCDDELKERVWDRIAPAYAEAGAGVSGRW
jgi:adenosine deaminase